MSGFRQDPNQLQPNFYRVVLTLSGGTGTYPTADGNDNGAVYPQDHSLFTTKPTTLAIGRRVARGHQRFLAIVEEVSKYADVQILDIEFTSAGASAADNQPTEVKFTVRYDRDTNVLPSLRAELFAANGDFNDAGGNAVNTTAKAVRQHVVQGITRVNYKKFMRIFDPVAGEERQEELTVTTPDAAADVYADTVVTLVDGTTVINP
jgi:hypothetical protein